MLVTMGEMMGRIIILLNHGHQQDLKNQENKMLMLTDKNIQKVVLFRQTIMYK